PAQSRIIMRPDGTRNVVITDHLGSTRLTLSTDAAPMQSQLHNAFGEVTSDVGEGARTGYIGREHDVESDLGFYGVRLYEPEYGRFMSTDPLWGEFITLQPYHYCRNQPLFRTDRGGMGDFFDEEGKHFGSDGVNDGRLFILTAKDFEGADPTMLEGNFGVYELPSADAYGKIINQIGGAAKRGEIREFGGVVDDQGNLHMSPAGPIATGISNPPQMNLTPSFEAIKEEGTKPAMTVHSHPNWEIAPGKMSMVQGSADPSGADHAVAEGRNVPGMILYPRNQQGSFTITFYSTKNHPVVKTNQRALEIIYKHNKEEK
ncbi:MAG TPA: RHS repeat-associated core domain-containing protein, partial [Chlorobiota bacterium]|nr:RHS repeat-associated core domain-containing protein [Chlorobiota bacterium]